MHINISKKTEFNKAVGFFDYWHLNEIDAAAPVPLEKTADKIAEKIRLTQISKQFPEHCVQLLFLS